MPAMASSRMLLLVALLWLAPQEPKDGLIELTVRDSVTHKGLAAVRVTMVYLNADSPSTVTTFTDAEGRVTAPNLAYGNYVLRIERDNYAVSDVHSIVPSFPKTLVISSTQKKHPLDAEMTPIATVSGRVLYSNGDPFPRAEVSLLSMGYSGGQRTLVPLGRSGALSLTDDRGQFRFDGVFPGEYYAKVNNSRLLGGAEGPDHLPRISYYPGVTDARMAAPLVIQGNDVSIDIRLPRDPVFKISGTVINPIPNRKRNPDDPDTRFVTTFFLASAEVNALEDPILLQSRYRPTSDPIESLFEIASIPAGSYFVYPLSDSDKGMITSKTRVEIKDRDVEGLRIVMKPNIDVNGKVVVNGDASSIRWESVKVGLLNKDRLPGLLRLAELSVTAMPDPGTGSFVLSGIVPESRFAPRISGLPPDAYISDLRQGARSVYRDGVIRSEPSEGPVEIHIDTRGGSISGSVRSALNEPVGRATVILVPDSGRRGNSLLYSRATTESSGEFTMRGIAPGEYKLFVWTAAPPRTAEEDAQFLAPYESSGTTVRVTAATRTDAQLRLPAQ
jgi:5-hydroxyisourate hydrolase-like protein (transthyretin family)